MHTKGETTHLLYEIRWNMKLRGQSVQRLESLKSKGMDGTRLQ